MTAASHLQLPWVESPFYSALVPQNCRTAEEEALARSFREDGYAILPGVMDGDLTERIQRETQGLFRPGVADGLRSAYRVTDAWKESPAVRELAGNARVLSALRLLYGREPFPFQTLNFQFGSQQRAHSDAIHFSCRPARFMCGVWAALEDVHDDNGPLFYYPGSHRLPEFNYYDIGMSVEKQDYSRYEDFIGALVEAQGFRKKLLNARRGDVLIWSSNLIHGGERIRAAGSTRWSQVTHYYFKDCVFYSPMHSNFNTGELGHREFRDVRTGIFIDQSVNGRPFSAIPIGNGRYRIREDLLWAGRAISAWRHGLSYGKRWLIRMTRSEGAQAAAYPSATS